MSDLSSDLAALRIDREHKPTGSKLKVIVILLVLAGLGVAAYLVVPRLSAQIFKMPVKLTEISLVSPAAASGGVELTSSGYVRPQLTSKVGARIAGRLQKVHVVEGQQVKQGDLLAELDDADYKAAVATAKARLTGARARTATARAQLAEMDSQLTRAKALFDKGAGPKADVDDLTARRRSLAAQVGAADADVSAAAAEVTALEVNLDYSKVTAPITGTIITKPLDVGELISPMVPTPLMEIADFESLAVEIDVPETKIGLIKPGSPAEITLDAFPGKRFRGQTLETASKVDRAKATVVVKVKFVDPVAETGILPDMAARVGFLSKPLDEAQLAQPPKLIVPGEAVVDRDGKKVVFTIVEGRARQVPVVLGAAFGSGFELTQGPPAGTKVVRTPPADLTDGQKVKEEN
jgi:HlyD family secretion protein